ncbi:hypothetical protein VTN00DRAFT_4389 [Thermoascus crustaceus]|uniref:uncharacterized protein n=1 Tax=Thermoascus crustaceus TaxID=5088 RepID=UPI0037445B82
MSSQGTKTSVLISDDGWFQTTHRYGEHDLQTVTVCARVDAMKGSHEGYWVIYIHGGAWRDPTITSASFDATQPLLRSSSIYTSTTLPHIAGFASIEYRLSPHPQFPQDNTSTTPTHLRAAKHPDHIHDVRDALALLQSRYGGVGWKCILVGHSCGATLAFQAVMGQVAGARPAPASTRLRRPMAVVGVEGIYDFRLLRNTYRDCNVYHEFIEGAFGPDEELWDAVSPAAKKGADGVEDGWREGRLAVLAHSRDDELVDFGQVAAMKEALEHGWAEKKKGAGEQAKIIVLEDLRGSHDEIWSKGEEMARVIAVTIGELRKMEMDS